MKTELLNKVQNIFRDIFEDDTLIITETTNAEDIDAWDSFNHINLVAAIESAFDVKFALGELQELENIGDMLVLIQEKK